MFSASLRLGRNYSDKDRAARVDAIIEDLGLEQCADTKVGNDEFRGISGGERKRTCIGMELITNPDVLFLDEPTTGMPILHTFCNFKSSLAGAYFQTDFGQYLTRLMNRFHMNR